MKTRPRRRRASPARTAAIAADIVANPFGLTPREILFVEAYCGVSQFNATDAYQRAGYETQKRISANAWRLTGRPRIAQAIAAKLATRVERLRIMDGDEALERLSLFARADIGKVLDPNDRLAKLPDDARLTIRGVRDTLYGRVIELHDPLRAAELLLKVHGRLKDVVKVDLEDLIAQSRAPRPGADA